MCTCIPYCWTGRYFPQKFTSVQNYSFHDKRWGWLHWWFWPKIVSQGQQFEGSPLGFHVLRLIFIYLLFLSNDDENFWERIEKIASPSAGCWRSSDVRRQGKEKHQKNLDRELITAYAFYPFEYLYLFYIALWPIPLKGYTKETFRTTPLF